MSSEVLFSGIDGETGGYAFRAAPDDLGRQARSAQLDAVTHRQLRDWLHELANRQGRSLREGDPRELEQAGWGVIFAEDDERAPAIREALEPLLSLRKGQVGAVREHYYQEYLGARGYRRGETKRQFLLRRGVGPGAADPDLLPYYLLIVGSPEQIPFSFQYQLDIEYAVGRLHFATIPEYAAYANNVKQSETVRNTRRRTKATFFGVENPDDLLTRVVSDELVVPLARQQARQPDWDVQLVLGEAATKGRLAHLLGGQETPDLLFTASHGVVFPAGDPRQLRLQGGLVCRDWPGPKEWQGKPLPLNFYLTGDDIASSSRLQGLLCFHFACFSAGTPAQDDFVTSGSNAIAPHAFLSHLPQRLLGLERGGALAVIGHVEKAWGCSVLWPENLPSPTTFRWIRPFEEVLRQLAAGHPVGSALEVFGKRYAELAADLTEFLQGEVLRGGAVQEESLLPLWMACNDARNYVVLGDPAVRLAAAEAKP
jgi:hypothetical protein